LEKPGARRDEGSLITTGLFLLKKEGEGGGEHLKSDGGESKNAAGGNLRFFSPHH